MRLKVAVLACVLLVGFKPLSSTWLCGAYTCWHLLGGGREGYACMNVFGAPASNVCTATTAGCSTGPCTRQFVTGPGARILAVLVPPCLSRRAGASLIAERS